MSAGASFITYSSGLARYAARPIRTIERLTASSIAARAAIADTWGTAHALARYAARPIRIAPTGGSAEAIAPLPLAALRLAPALGACPSNRKSSSRGE